MDNLEISLEFLGGLTGHTPDQLKAELQVEGSENFKPKEEIQAFISTALSSKFKSTRKAGYDEGHRLGMKKGLTDLEVSLTQKHGIPLEEGKTAMDYIDAAIEKSTKALASGKLTPESVKAHPTYVEDLRTEIEKRTTLESEFNNFKTGIEKEKVGGTLRKQALALLEKHKFALPANEAIREKQINQFMAELMGDLQFDLEGENVKEIKDKGGNQLRNDMMNAKSFEEHVTGVAKGWFEVQSGDGRTSPGTTTQTASPGAAGTGPVIKDANEYFAHYNSLTTLAEKEALQKQYSQKLKEGF